LPRFIDVIEQGLFCLIDMDFVGSLQQVLKSSVKGAQEGCNRP